MKFYSYSVAHPFVPGKIQFITVSERVAIAEFKAFNKINDERELSDFVALEGWISMHKAREVPEPLARGYNIADYMAIYCRRFGSTAKAAKKLNVHPNVINDVLSGKRVKLPGYVLKIIGLRQVVTLMPVYDDGIVETA